VLPRFKTTTSQLLGKSKGFTKVPSWLSAFDVPSTSPGFAVENLTFILFPSGVSLDLRVPDPSIGEGILGPEQTPHLINTHGTPLRSSPHVGPRNPKTTDRTAFTFAAEIPHLHDVTY
jgi:hypothetical protein